MRSLLLALAIAAFATDASVAKECTPQQQELDRARMVAATKDGNLKADPESGRDGITLSVFVSEAFWGRMPFLEKVDFAESLVCAWAGVGKGILVLHLRSEMSGQVTGEWRLNRLTVPTTTPSIPVERGAETDNTPKGSGFSCDASENVCRCDGDANGADCAAMKRNCSGDIQCTEFRGASSCTCRMQTTESTKQAPLIKTPSGASGKF
jgi:hypothetical protein